MLVETVQEEERIGAGLCQCVGAADFFSVEVLTVGGFVRYLVFFVIDLKTRRVHIAARTMSGGKRAWARWLTRAMR